MLRPLPLLAAITLAATTSFAPAKEGTPATIETLSQQFEAAIATLNAQHEERVKRLVQSYAAQLGKTQQAYAIAGDLDAALATRNEAEALSTAPLPPEALAKMPQALREARGKFETALATYTANAAAQRVAPLQKFIALLKAAETDLTKTGDLDAALAARKKRLVRERQLATLMKNATTPSSRPALPPVVREPPTRQSFAASDAKLETVAKRLAARGSVDEPAPKVIAFDAPRGDGRVGAKGIIYQNDTAPTEGSTWQFVYRRAIHAKTMQIIHPHKDGQFITHVSMHGAGISSAEKWSDITWGGGSSDRSRRTRAADDIFPLEDGEDFQFLSRLEANGSYSLFINGTLCYTARAGRTHPLDTASFKGEDLPEAWSPGWAGLIVGPIDKGENSCNDIRFAPAALPDPAAPQ